jgi:hypothetical protein
LGVRDGSRAISVRQSLASANRFPPRWRPAGSLTPEKPHYSGKVGAVTTEAPHWPGSRRGRVPVGIKSGRLSGTNTYVIHLLLIATRLRRVVSFFPIVALVILIMVILFWQYGSPFMLLVPVQKAVFFALSVMLVLSFVAESARSPAKRPSSKILKHNARPH